MEVSDYEAELDLLHCRDYQKQAVIGAFNCFDTAASSLIVLPTGCHSAEQGILMFDGTVKRADHILIGDRLMGPDSSPRTVTRLVRGHDRMFMVTPVKGEPWKVNADHILSLVATNTSSMPAYPSEIGGKITNVSVRDWQSWSRSRKHINKLYRASVDFQNLDILPIDPYVLGVILGDGSCTLKSITVSKPSMEIRNEISRCGQFEGYAVSEHNMAVQSMCKLGIARATSGTKFIPREYKTASRQERLRLLAGLLDTDGSVIAGGGFDYLSKSKQLAEDVAFVCRSIGLAAYIKPCTKSCQNLTGEYFRVGISGDCSVIPTLIPEKQSPGRNQKKNVLRTGFTVDDTGVDEDYFGFTVDGDNLYLLGDFTVTHNCGKTHIGGAICRIWDKYKDGRILWIANRKELIHQAAARIEKLTGAAPEIEMADSKAATYGLLANSNVVVASIQSLMAGRKCLKCDGTGGVLRPCEKCNGNGCDSARKTLDGDGNEIPTPCDAEGCEGRGTIATEVDCPFCLGGKVRRLQKFRPDEFGLIVTDECFPAHTEVSGRPIADIQTGDFVDSYNHETGNIEQRIVLHKFKSVPSSLIRVHFSNGRLFECTPEHPVFASTAHCAGRYIAAKDLTEYHMVHCITKNTWSYTNGDQPKEMRGLRDGLCATKLEQHNDPSVLRGVQNNTKGSQKKNSNLSMLCLRRGRRMLRKNHVGSGSQRTGVLFRSMPNILPKHNKGTGYGRHKSEICVRANEAKQPNAQRSFEGEDENNAPRNGMEATSARGERNRTDRNATTTCIRTRVGNGAYYCDRSRKTERTAITKSLQTRHCKSHLNDRDRSGRTIPQCSGSQSTGHQKSELAQLQRVVRIEVLEQGSDGRFGGVCEDGFVYNLEVEGNNNYFANGVLVHNCHHAVASTYRRVYRWFGKNERTKTLGLTATPDRSDEGAMGQVFQTVAINVEMPWAIDNGWLVPINQKSITCEHLDFSNVRTTAGDLNAADLERLLTNEESLHEMVAPTVELAGDRRTLVFCVDKMHTRLVCELINRYKPNSARYILGCTSEQERDDNFKAHRSGEYQFLVNCGVTTEGYDDPGIQVVAVMRPTKSRALYVQMCGRGIRPIEAASAQSTADDRKAWIAASSKTEVLILDYVGNAGRHKLITAFDLFSGHYTEEVLDRAKRISTESDEELPTEEAVRRAQAELDAEEEKRKEAAEAKKREFLKAREAKFKAESVDPFAWWDTLPTRIGAEKQGQAASDAQVSALMQMGVEPYKLEDISAPHASVMLDTLSKRRKENLASYKQAKLLKKNGLNPDITFSQARNVIDALAGNGWRMTDSIRAMAPMREVAGT